MYRRDWNYEHLFVDIKNKMPQVITAARSSGCLVLLSNLGAAIPVRGVPPSLLVFTVRTKECQWPP